MDSEQNQISTNLLFVFGPARGGTTFLANLLTQWLDFADAPEGQFVGAFLKRHSSLGGELGLDDLERLAEELAQVAMLNIIRERWPEELAFDVNSQDIIDCAYSPSIDGLIYGVFAAVSKRRGAKRVGNKNPDYWKDLPQLHAAFGTRAKYLFIQRDGRDVYLSQDKQIWGGQSVYAAAKTWRRMSSCVRDFTNKHPVDILTIRYEDLLSNPQPVFGKIAEFVGCDEREKQNAVSGFVEDHMNSELANNYNKWTTEMSSEDARLFERAAGDELKAWDYQCQSVRTKGSVILDIHYGVLEFIRLIRLNLYELLNGYMPADKKKWQNNSGFARLLGRWLYSKDD